MLINLLTATPEFFDSPLKSSIVGRAQSKGLVQFQVLCLRDFADGNNKKQVDDTPYGGGPGMILKIEPLVRALNYLQERKQKGQVILTSPAGKTFNQQLAKDFSKLDTLTIIYGHYEGVDARIKNYIDREVSIGDFVLTGGEGAAYLMIDASVRLIAGVLGNQESLSEESFNSSEVEYPQYTKPREFDGHSVPEVLLSGNHAEIKKWRQEQQLSRT